MASGAFHSTKISANFGSKSNGTENFQKFVLKIWNFQKFPVPFGISTWYETAPVPVAEKLQDGGESFKLALHWMQNDLPQFEPVLDCLFSTKKVRI